eukprot:9663461-Alexandrium_andersonii.AAC.1
MSVLEQCKALLAPLAAEGVCKDAMKYISKALGEEPQQTPPAPRKLFDQAAKLAAARKEAKDQAQALVTDLQAKLDQAQKSLDEAEAQLEVAEKL